MRGRVLASAVLGGEVSWRRRGGFSSCNKVSGVMFKKQSRCFWRRSSASAASGRVVTMKSHCGCLRGAGLSVFCSFERGSINAAAVLRRPPDRLSTQKLFESIRGCSIFARCGRGGGAGWGCADVLCFARLEAVFVVSFLSLQTARRRTLELTCRASASAWSHLDDIARGAI